MLGGLDYANDLSSWLPSRPADGNSPQLVASFHNYETQACHTAACWNSTIAPVARRVPVVTGEFGETDCADSHVKSYMNWADRRGVGYLAWAWWVLEDKSCSTLSVLSDLKATPKAPNGTALKAHLATLVPPRLSLGGPVAQHLDGAVEVQVRCSKTCHLARVRQARDRQRPPQGLRAEDGRENAPGAPHRHPLLEAVARRDPSGRPGLTRRPQGDRNAHGHGERPARQRPDQAAPRAARLIRSRSGPG